VTPEGVAGISLRPSSCRRLYFTAGQSQFLLLCYPEPSTRGKRLLPRESTCDECKEELGSKAWITLKQGKGALCLSCADLDHLVFLPSGDAAVTRRARKHSTLSAVVLKWSKARKRYERQGLLVEEPALRQAETECLADEDARAQRRIREAERRAKLDSEYVKRFAEAGRQLYPKCRPKTAQSIAEHACTKYSGRMTVCRGEDS